VTHADGLLIGCLVAVLLGGRGPARGEHVADAQPASVRQASAPLKSGQPAAWAAGALLAGLMIVSRVDSGWTYTVCLTVAGLSTAVLLRHLAVADDGALVRLLSVGPLVAIGRVSYGLYLFHVPVFHLVGSMKLGYGATIAVEYSASAALTVLSWYLVEQPVQRWVHRRWPRQHITLDEPPSREPQQLVCGARRRAPSGAVTSGVAAESEAP